MGSKIYAASARCVVIWLAACAFSTVVQAQTELQVQLPASALECLQTHATDGGTPAYPSNELTMKASAAVRVQLTFRSPESAPKVKVVSNTGSDVFADAVEAFVENYRLPCLANHDNPVVATQEFVFQPGDGRKVVFSAVNDEANVKLGRACFQMPDTKPRYPRRAGEMNQGGTVLAEVSFHEINAEPIVRIIYGAGSESLAASVESHMKAYRLICPLPSAVPIRATQSFVFHISGNDRHALKDMGLMNFLRTAVPADLSNAKFNFNTMGCPFDVSVRVRRPHADNVVGEYGESDPRRKEFVKWLEKLRLQLPANLEPYLFDQQVKVSVPCASLDL